jgi:hypothetical protein
MGYPRDALHSQDEELPQMWEINLATPPRYHLPSTDLGGHLDDIDARWEALMQEIEKLSNSSSPSEGELARLNVKIGALHLVQPFDWNAWEAPPLDQIEIGQLTLADCVRHITRLVRLNRFAEGVLMSAVAEGDLMALVTQARKQAGGRPIPSVLNDHS